MELVMVYITTSSYSEAKSIGEAIVSERLAACVNILEGMHAIYWWEEKIQKEQEVIIIAKTRKELLSNLIEKVRSMHSYTCPCILSLPITGGYSPFLEWISLETLKGRH
ncbi:MAG: divalent-cation tolerance protein CutA [Desulfobacteraceae bacterium]|jgi:periplasmic divalent cation tolerance protein|nr:MAG: divalent-cation tolerance protein CutA [Desulfobacteraceae bacterium]